MQRICAVVCILILSNVFGGCDLAELPYAIFDEKREEQNQENMTFSGAVFEDEIPSDNLSEFGSESEEIATGVGACGVDSGLVVWEVTDENKFYIYHKFGINTTGVIIFESQNTDKLEFGDKIIKINDKEIDSACDIDRIISEYEVGDSIEVTVLRDGETISVLLTLTKEIPDSVTFN